MTPVYGCFWSKSYIEQGYFFVLGPDTATLGKWTVLNEINELKCAWIKTEDWFWVDMDCMKMGLPMDCIKIKESTLYTENDKLMAWIEKKKSKARNDLLIPLANFIVS